MDRDAFTKRLLHVKGRRNITVSQVKLAGTSLNSGDVFILDAGRQLYQWNGTDASGVEKRKAMEVTRSIKDEERGGRASIQIFDAGDDDAAFWQAMGEPKPSSIAVGIDDAEHEKSRKNEVKLYHLSDASGELVVREVVPPPARLHNR